MGNRYRDQLHRTFIIGTPSIVARYKQRAAKQKKEEKDKKREQEILMDLS